MKMSVPPAALRYPHWDHTGWLPRCRGHKRTSAAACLLQINWLPEAVRGYVSVTPPQPTQRTRGARLSTSTCVDQDLLWTQPDSKRNIGHSRSTSPVATDRRTSATSRTGSSSHFWHSGVVGGSHEWSARCAYLRGGGQCALAPKSCRIARGLFLEETTPCIGPARAWTSPTRCT